MRDFNLSAEARPEALQFAGATNGGSFVRSRPRSPFSAAEERELASGLLQVTSEAELEQVLGDLLDKAQRGDAPAAPKAVGPIGGLLKTVAKRALPSLATTVGPSFDGPAGDANAGKLGSLVNQALQAKVAGITASDPNLEKCRQLLEKHRQFVRLAGKAARAAALAPPGVAPIAAAQKILADSAREALMRKSPSAGLAGKFAAGPQAVAAMKPAARAGKIVEGALPAVAMKPAAAAGRAAAQLSRTEIKAPGSHTCCVCELPPGSCVCGKPGQSGRWFRSGNSIIVKC
jgi:hypothetical protein